MKNIYKRFTFNNFIMTTYQHSIEIGIPDNLAKLVDVKFLELSHLYPVMSALRILESAYRRNISRPFDQNQLRAFYDTVKNETLQDSQENENRLDKIIKEFHVKEEKAYKDYQQLSVLLELADDGCYWDILRPKVRRSVKQTDVPAIKGRIISTPMGGMPKR